MPAGESKGPGTLSNRTQLEGYVNEYLAAARSRAAELIEKVSLNEAIKVIEGLEVEVSAMVISSRFRRDRKPSESVMASVLKMNPNFAGLTEDEYKRETLLLALRKIKNDILLCITTLEDVVLDMEATKRED